MALPKINNVLYDLELPSSGEVVEYRPFLVKEEKILLMALEGKDEKEMVKAIKQIITQCVATEKFNINKLAMVDLEYLFLNIRGKAVGDVSTISFEHECGEIIKLDVDLSKVEIVNNKNISGPNIDRKIAGLCQFLMEKHHFSAGLARRTFVGFTWRA